MTVIHRGGDTKTNNERNNVLERSSRIGHPAMEIIGRLVAGRPYEVANLADNAKDQLLEKGMKSQQK
jgi:hypothetical protein